MSVSNGRREDVNDKALFKVLKSNANLRNFTFQELKVATNGFKLELEKGAFGTFYKGELSSSNSRTVVAVKKLDKLENNVNEFKTEANVIARTHHKNLVRLVGFCDEVPEMKLLVYELCHGSLADFLFARISDFGLAKLLMKDQTQTLTGIRRTKGYVAPEWFRNTAVTAKVDVYSYGIVLLETICCRKCMDDEEALRDMRELEKLVKVAMWCIQEDPNIRPSMRSKGSLGETLRAASVWLEGLKSGRGNGLSRNT
ncbi:hypothetical protein HAX54_030258, partial [Datura stramonium]|nr:hypothetical protein [Datura stramonium]